MCCKAWWTLHWWMLDKDTCKSLVVFFSFCKTFHQKYSVFSAVLCFIFTQLLTFTPGSYNYISLLLDTAAPLGLDTVVFLAVGRASEIKRSFCLLDPPTVCPGSIHVDPLLPFLLFNLCASILFIHDWLWISRFIALSPGGCITRSYPLHSQCHPLLSSFRKSWHYL